MKGKIDINKKSFESFMKTRGTVSSGNLDNIDCLIGVKPIDEATNLDITFCRFEGQRGKNLLQKTSAGLIFIPSSIKDPIDRQNSILVSCEFPRLEMLKFLSIFWEDSNLNEGYLTADNKSIHETATIAPDVQIGKYTVIGPGVKIGKGSRIGPNCNIENADIGKNAKIASNVSIGGSGFGFEDDPITKEVLEFPHVGGVTIGDNVSVGSSTCIDRGGLGNTLIGNDVKIDNLVHISHNVKIGDRCKVIALSMIGGSVELGEDSWISPSSAVRDWRKVGKGALIGLGAVVTKDIESNKIVIGNPAKPIEKKVGRYK